MQYILLGLVAFLLAPAFEFVSIKGVRGGKQIIGLASLVLWGLAIRGVCRHPHRLSVSTWLVILAWITLVLSAMLLFYSLFVEIPFKRTYHSPGIGQQLVTTGTYALVRHPGIDKITFTGRHQTGVEMLEAAKVGMKGVMLELGGNAPASELQTLLDRSYQTAQYLLELQ